MTRGYKQVAKRRRKALERARAIKPFFDLKTKNTYVTVLTSIAPGRNP